MLSILLDLIDEQCDKELFEELYYRYQKQMWYVANEILKDKHRAEDATQNAFIRLAKHIKIFRTLDENSTRKYFLTTAKNAARDIAKKEQKLKTVNMDYLYNLYDGKSTNEIENLENDILLVTTLNKLPPKYNDVMHMHFVLGVGEKEIAQALNIKVNTVRQQIHRGRKMFKELYDKEASKDEN